MNGFLTSCRLAHCSMKWAVFSVSFLHIGQRELTSPFLANFALCSCRVSVPVASNNKVCKHNKHIYPNEILFECPPRKISSFILTWHKTWLNGQNCLFPSGLIFYFNFFLEKIDSSLKIQAQIICYLAQSINLMTSTK